MTIRVAVLAVGLMGVLGGAAVAQQQAGTLYPGDDMARDFKVPARDQDYDKRVVMVPMRDGTKLYTVIVVPKGAKGAPILLTRTPYDAKHRAERSDSPRMKDMLPLSDEPFVEAGYIRVYQDVRGKYGSEGVYLMTPPPVGPFNSSGADDTTDAYDTIDWLVKNVPESNGRVGMMGSSYEGYTVVMALLHPHPALKVADPESPMVDGWMGDDWFHYGAFREVNLDYFLGQTTKRGEGVKIPREGHDDYTNFLKAGSAGDFARALGEDQLPYWKTVEGNAAYTPFWQSQALDKLIVEKPLTVPTLWEQGLWDQEDMWGAIHSYRGLEAVKKSAAQNHIVMGPWRHSQANADGHGLGPFVWPVDTAEQWRREYLLPFFNEYLKPGSPKFELPKALIYNTGLSRWETPKVWPASCEKGCPEVDKPLYLEQGGTLSFEAPKTGAQFDEYVSDPMKPVPYRPRPVVSSDRAGWGAWLVTDQRFVDGRPDVLTYVTEPLKEPMKLSGEPVAHLFASTSGTDSDWVVKIIDVYPERDVAPFDLSGAEIPVSLDIFRGRYRKSFEKPEAIPANVAEEYTFGLPMVNHTFLPGHRLIVQVQSTLFPLYDRNPQTFVPNIFDAKAGEYQKATQKIWHMPGTASYVSLPVVE